MLNGGLAHILAVNLSIDPNRTDFPSEHYLSFPVNFGMSSPTAPTSPSPSSAFAGSVLPLRRAEELIATLTGVLSVRIVPSDTGSVDEIHVLTTNEIVPKNMVRNIESALMAQLGLRINHRKISIATSLDPVRAADAPIPRTVGGAPTVSPADQYSGEPVELASGAIPGVASSAYARKYASPPTSGMAEPATASASAVDTQQVGRRVLMFEDVEVRRSRTRGALCRVTLRRDAQEFIGEAEGQESPRARIDIAAQAAVAAIVESMKSNSSTTPTLALEGSKHFDAFDREFIFVSVMARLGREAVTLTGSCEVRESPETSAVLAVLDATNRWIHFSR